MKIVFMGTPNFALPCLEVVARHHQLVGVVTQPDRKKGRGGKISAPPVKVRAQELGVPILQPARIKDPDALAVLKAWSPEIIVVVAYGEILPSSVLKLPPRGCINLHASLLPQYRGAAPIPRAIMDGQRVTGVTTMYMDEGMDTGDIILQQEVPIGEDMTAGELSLKLAQVGAGLLEKTLALIEQGRASAIPQDHSRASYAPMLRSEDEIIDWSKPAPAIVNLVRALNPDPGARSRFRDKVLKVWKAKALDWTETEGESMAALPSEVAPGTIIQLRKGEGPVVACGHGGAILIQELQLEGKSAISGGQFLNGYRPTEAEKLG